MEPFHPLANDTDADLSQVAAAQAECMLALGRLDGLLAGLDGPEKRLFCWSLLRTVLLSALRQAGFTDADLRFDAWFTGTGRAPEEGPLTACSARAIVQAILAEVVLRGWDSLAQAARQVQAMGRFAVEHADSHDHDFARDALERARILVSQAATASAGSLPFPALSRLTSIAAKDAQFAPLERGTRILSIGRRDFAYEQASPHTPLWAIDIVLGSLLASCGTWHIPLPCPGVVSAQSLAAQHWEGERHIMLSESITAMAERLLRGAEAARYRATIAKAACGPLRSNAKAPLVWMAAIGFAPLGLDQVIKGFHVSRRGTYTISDALIAAGLVTRRTNKGMVILTGQEPRMANPHLPAYRSASRPSPTLAQFDEAMAEIDRLLARIAAPPV